MPFQPSPNDSIAIDGFRYTVAQHPAAPGVAYGQEGRAGIVYQVLAPDGSARALKVFKPRFQAPALVGLAEKLEAFAEAPGLQVCRRLVLTARRHRELLRQYPELNYAVLMPWVAGPTWMQVIGERRTLMPAQSLALAQSLLETLTAMEERGLAHCDLSGPNMLLPALLDGGAAEPHGVALVDVEQFYGPGLEKPDLLPAGSAGYAHRTAPQGLWSARADRFAGAILLAEMLSWCEASVRQAAAGESYFDPTEIHQDSARYRTLVTALRRRWGASVSTLLEHAWESETLADCPNFGQWLTALPEAPLADDEREEDTATTDTASDGALAAVRALMVLGRQFETEGNMSSALSTYKQALAQAPTGGVRDELVLIMQRLEQATALPPSADELAALFDDGLTAYQRGDWAKARELLSEVTRRQPGYARAGKRAAAVLAEVENRLARNKARSEQIITQKIGEGRLAREKVEMEHLALERSQQQPAPAWLKWVWLVVSLVAIMVVGAVIMNSADNQPVATQTSATLVVVSTDTPRPSTTPVPPTATKTSIPPTQTSAVTFTPTTTPIPPTKTRVPPTPIPPTKSRQLVRVYDNDSTGNHEVYAEYSDGSTVNLTNNPAGDVVFTGGFNGGRIAFVSNRDGNVEVYVMNSDGSAPTRLTNNPGYDGAPVWSPTGAQIAFMSDRDGNHEIYIMSADGSNQVNLTQNPANDSAAITWLPDGRIRFNRDGTPFAMNPDGSNQSPYQP